MTLKGSTRGSAERRREERERERDEERRQKELERRREELDRKAREEEAERRREEERREESRQQSRELEASLERARERREAMINRIRVQKRQERVEASRDQRRREALLDALRQANLQRQKGNEQPQRTPSATQQPSEKRSRPEPEGTALPRAGRSPIRQAAKPKAPPTGPADTRKAGLGEIRAQARRQEEVIRDRRELKRTSQFARENRARLAEDQRVGRLEAERQSQATEKKRDQETGERRETERQRRRALAQKELRRRLQAQALRESAREARQADARRTDLHQEARGTERVSPPAEREREEKPAPVRDPLLSRFPSGTLSGGLAWLVTYENRMSTAAGDPVTLRGVNLCLNGSAIAVGGLEPWTRTVGNITGWGATVIRLTLDPASAGGLKDGSPVFDVADAVISAASSSRCYTVISAPRPYWNGPGSGTGDMIRVWQLLSERYVAEPAVLFDLGPPPEDMDHPSISDRWALWLGLVRELVSEIRVRHPRSLCFVAGMDGGSDLSGFPVPGRDGRAAPNLVYTARLMPRQPDPWPQLKRLAAAHTCFVTEWGGEPQDVSWGERTALMLESLSIGWTATAWTGPLALVTTSAGRVVPTPMGKVIKRALATARERAEAGRLGRFRILM